MLFRSLNESGQPGGQAFVEAGHGTGRLVFVGADVHQIGSVNVSNDHFTDVSWEHFEGAVERLRWSLGHLLQNALRYTEPGGHIIITAGPTGENQIAVQVIDNGVGISKKDLPHIFDRFYRGEPRTRSGKLLDPRGLGQGLFVARTVTETHGGYLSVQSEVGQGSVFTMVLPEQPPEGSA